MFVIFAVIVFVIVLIWFVIVVVILASVFTVVRFAVEVFGGMFICSDIWLFT